MAYEMSLPPELQDAYDEQEASATALAEAVSLAYPVGAIISVTIGRALIRGTVERSGGAWWADPDVVCIRNLVTGARRKFHPKYSDAKVVG